MILLELRVVSLIRDKGSIRRRKGARVHIIDQ